MDVGDGEVVGVCSPVTADHEPAHHQGAAVGGTDTIARIQLIGTLELTILVVPPGRAVLPEHHFNAELSQNGHGGSCQWGAYPFLRNGKIVPGQFERGAGCPGRCKAFGKPVKSGSEISTRTINGFSECTVKTAFAKNLPAVNHADILSPVSLRAAPRLKP